MAAAIILGIYITIYCVFIDHVIIIRIIMLVAYLLVYFANKYDSF